MQQKWTGKNVRLDMLAQSIEDFFRNKGFPTNRTDSNEEYTIAWEPRPTSRNLQNLTRSRVFGTPNDFTVEIMASELTTGAVRIGLFTKSVGGGYFALKNLQMKEKLGKLESEFWVFVEEKIADLEGSASV